MNNILRFEIDFLRFCVTEDSHFLDSFFTGLSLNSNTTRFTFLNYVFDCVYFSTNGKQILQFFYEGQNLFVLEKNLGKGAVNYPYFFIFYGAFFYSDLYPNFLHEFIATFKKNLKLTRFDLALDVQDTVNTVLKSGVKNRLSKTTEFKTGKTTETIYLGSKSHLNKKHFCRIYDKKLDSLNKNKTFLQSFYSNFDSVSRIEIQFNSQSCTNFFIQKNLFNKTHWLKLFDIVLLNKKSIYLNYLKNLDFNEDKIKSLRPLEKQYIPEYSKEYKQIERSALRLQELGFDVQPIFMRILQTL